MHSAKIEIMDRSENILAFSFVALGALINITVTVVFFQAIYMQTSTLGGWEIHEVYLLLGTFFLINNIAWSSYVRGFNHLPKFVENGNLDVLLTKPVNLRTYLGYRYIDIIFGNPQLIAALGLIYYGISQSSMPINIPMYLILLLFAIVIHFSVTSMFYTINFFYILPQSTLLYGQVFKLGRNPITVYKGFFKIFLSIIIPIGFIFSVPAKTMFGNLSLSELLGSIALVVIFYTISRLFWKYGLNNYQSAQG